jgi:hypothetical protein
MFNKAAEKFFDVLQQDKVCCLLLLLLLFLADGLLLAIVSPSRLSASQVYLIRNGTLKVANRQYSRINNDYELTLNEDCEITLCADDTSIQHQQFDLVPIASLKEKNKNDFVDICGVVLHVSENTPITLKKNPSDKLAKRVITLTDASDAMVCLLLSFSPSHFLSHSFSLFLLRSNSPCGRTKLNV